VDLDIVVFGWPANSFTGWGVPGINLMLYWHGTALSAHPDFSAELGPRDKRAALLRERQQQSVWLQEQIGRQPGMYVLLDAPVFAPLGNGFEPHRVAGNRLLSGKPTIGFAAFEDLHACGEAIGLLSRYAAVITYSAWNAAFLVEHGINARCVHQGYDPALFGPGVRQQTGDGRFRVFSGGKCERRKGQDITLKAFKRFSEGHGDAVLVAAWGNPWPGLVNSFAGTDIGAPPGAELGMPNYRAWAQGVGIRPHQVEIVHPVPNWQMPDVYGRCDVALFPNREECGTNIVAMEAGACGLPCLMSAAPGHDELPWDAAKRHETGNIDAIVADLEAAYAGKIVTQPLGEEWAWPARFAELRGALEAML
jgi:glycosyltransferase involved in cell wall biosynthesis